MLNYEIFMKELKKAILNISGWKAENVRFVPKEENEFGEDRLEIICIESATHVGCDSLGTDEFYKEYCDGKKIQRIAKELVAYVKENSRKRLFNAMVEVLTYDKAKSRLFIVPENINNKEALEQSTYKTVGDIALGISLNLMEKGENMIGLKVSQEILDVWEKGMEEVFSDALKNSAKMFPARYYSIFRALTIGKDYKGDDFMGEDAEEVLADTMPEKCISTESFDHGSVAIFYPGVGDKLCEALRTENLYLTFTSVNEVLVRPADSEVSISKMKERLKKELKQNRNPKDKLTEEIYYYDGKNHCIRLASGEGNVFLCK